MGLEGVKVGDEVWVVAAWRTLQGKAYAVTSVGRKWVQTSAGSRFDVETGGDSTGAWRAYRSESAYQEQTRMEAGWVDTYSRLGFRPPSGMTLGTIQQVRALLGLPAWEG